MAEPFQPKFVDLVRNTFSTTGTGNFSISQAINGFTSFVGALSPGDQFYYCAINNDKPGEREVGRGTMMADGTIARDPVQGALVNFSGGNKVIALVTPAEWFNTMQAGGAGGIPFAATRSALAATASAAGACTLREAGREGLFVFDPANRSAEVAADGAQGLFVAPTGQNGSAGAWVRRHSGPVNVRWFGATGDGTSNDGAAFVAALSALKALAGNVSANGFYKAGAKLFVPAGHYYLGSTTLDVSHTLVIEGDGCGLGGTAGATRLRWATSATGIRVQRYNTSGAATVDGTTHFAGDGLTLRGLHLVGGYAGTEGEYHGVHAKGRIAVEDCVIANFAGDGIYSNCVSGSGSGATEGNANNSSIRRCRIENCRDGIFVDGADTNVWDVQAVDVSGNRRWGINDSSFLGNCYLACHSDSNGLVPGTAPSVVSHSGNRYAVKAGQEAGAATNAPSGSSADNAWWYYLGTGAASAPNNIPAWSNPTTVRAGGAYRTDNANACNVFTGCYSESGQGPAQFVPPTLVLGGGQFAGVKGVARAYVRPGGLLASSEGLAADGNLAITGVQSDFGPLTGAATDSTTNFNNTNFYNYLTFKSWSAGTPQTDAELLSARGFGFILKGYPGIQLRHGPSNTTILDMSAAGVAVTGTLSATGAVTGSNLSGNNSGDQIITLTGDVTGSGGGSFAAAIASNAVTYAKMQDVSAASRLIGRGSSGAGDPQEITLGSRLSISGTTLNASGDWTELTLASDFTCANSTSFNDITDGTTALSYTPPANSNYEIQAVLLIQTATATNLPRVQVNVAAQGTGALGCVQIDQTGATAAARVTADGSYTTTAATVATAAGDLPAANTPYMCFITIRGRSGPSPAAIKLQAACETAAANACFVKAGSQMRTKAS
jgi:hypothetical protein